MLTHRVFLIRKLNASPVEEFALFVCIVRIHLQRRRFGRIDPPVSQPSIQPPQSSPSHASNIDQTQANFAELPTCFKVIILSHDRERATNGRTYIYGIIIYCLRGRPWPDEKLVVCNMTVVGWGSISSYGMKNKVQSSIMIVCRRQLH